MPIVIVLFALWSALLSGCYQLSADPSPHVAVNTLIGLLHDPDMVMRRTAAEALGKIGDPQAVPSLVLALDDHMFAVREAAVRSLSQVGPLERADGERVAGLLVDPVPAVRIAAAQTLAALDRMKDLWPRVVQQLAVASSDQRQTMIQALEGVDDPEAVEAISNAVHDSDPQVRRAAVVALAESSVPQVAAVLRERLTTDPSGGVRAEAAYRLQFFSVSEGVEDLKVTAGQDEHQQVRRWAEQTLRGLEATHDSDSTRPPGPPAGPAPSHRYP